MFGFLRSINTGSRPLVVAEPTCSTELTELINSKVGLRSASKTLVKITTGESVIANRNTIATSYRASGPKDLMSLLPRTAIAPITVPTQIKCSIVQPAVVHTGMIVDMLGIIWSLPWFSLTGNDEFESVRARADRSAQDFAMCSQGERPIGLAYIWMKLLDPGRNNLDRRLPVREPRLRARHGSPSRDRLRSCNRAHGHGKSVARPFPQFRLTLAKNHVAL